MTTADFLNALCHDPRFAAGICHVEDLPKQDASYGETVEPLPASISGYLDRHGFRLYTHQADALAAFRDGDNVLLRTSTASGKTLAFTLPVAERMVIDPAATALFLYPTKALSNDQFQFLQGFAAETGISLTPALYDGDTPRERRAAIRDRSRVIISNPHELHQVLGWHHLFERFLSNLSAVVIDEAHRYRGVAGSNMAFLIRRLRRLCDRYGSRPRFVMATATIGNPGDFAERLLGLPVTIIERDGAPRARKQFVFYNPVKNDRSPHTDACDLLSAGVKYGLQTICFSGSRKMAELISRWADEASGHQDAAGRPLIATYRAGYLPAERRDLERGLKEGTIRGVVATNALELGIDIGSLDVVIMAGYPGTLMSAWQQSGRAGRKTDDSLAVLIGYQNPLDQYYMQHPAEFFSKNHEAAAIDLSNPYILSSQVLCAASEMPIVPARDKHFFGACTPAIVEALEQENLVKKTGKGYVYSGRKRPADFVSMGGAEGETYTVLCEGRVLETMDRGQAFREAHPGAVLLHQGMQYLSRGLDTGTHLITVEPVEVDYYTKPLKEEEVRVIGTRDARWIGDLGLNFGDVTVHEQYTGFKKILDGATIAVESLDLPAIEFNTTAVWFELPSSLVHAVSSNGSDLHGGLHGTEHALIGMFPSVVLCDRWDIGGLSVPAAPPGGGPTVFIYDGYEGGIGLSETAYYRFEHLVRTTADLVRSCGCSEGCPACIYSPKCGNDNQPLDKAATCMILGLLHEECMKNNLPMHE